MDELYVETKEETVKSVSAIWVVDKTLEIAVARGKKYEETYDDKYDSTRVDVPLTVEKF
jgi:hypothetical protein